MNKQPSKNQTNSNSCTFEQKWGDDPFTALGHTQVPNALMRYAARLKLAPDECWLITCILLFKRSEADPYPSQETLTAMYGRSVDTVQRVVKSIRAKGLMNVLHKRGELGHFSHIVYDFVPLRMALNECYYQYHPESRPKYSRPVPLSAIPQECGMADGKPRNRSHTARMRYGTDAVSHAAKTAKPMPHGCGANQTLEKKIEKDGSEFSASLFEEQSEDKLDRLPHAEYAVLEAAARARVIAEKGDPIRTLARQGKAMKDVKIMMRQILTEKVLGI